MSEDLIEVRINPRKDYDPLNPVCHEFCTCYDEKTGTCRLSLKPHKVEKGDRCHWIKIRVDKDDEEKLKELKELQKKGDAVLTPSGEWEVFKRDVPKVPL